MINNQKANRSPSDADNKKTTLETAPDSKLETVPEISPISALESSEIKLVLPDESRQEIKTASDSDEITLAESKKPDQEKRTASDQGEIELALLDKPKQGNKTTSSSDEITLAEPSESGLKNDSPINSKDFERNSQEKTRNNIVAIRSPDADPIKQENKNSENKLANKIAVYFATFLPAILGVSGTIALFSTGFIAPACACLFFTVGSFAAGTIYIKKYEALSNKSSNRKLPELRQQSKGEALNNPPILAKKLDSPTLLITNGEEALTNSETPSIIIAQDSAKEPVESPRKSGEQAQGKNDKNSAVSITSAENSSELGITPRADSEGAQDSSNKKTLTSNTTQTTAENLSRAKSAPDRFSSSRYQV
jgi:hypothetical protein